MPWDENTTLSQRILLCKLALEGKISLSQLARDFNISRKTANKWVTRYKEHGEAGLLDLSRKPQHAPKQTPEQMVTALLERKQLYPTWGARKLHTLLQRELKGEIPSVTTLHRLLQQHHKTNEALPKATQNTVERFQRTDPNALWQMDFTSPLLLPQRQNVYPLPILDDCTRFCLHLGLYPDCSQNSALAGLREAAKQYGLPTAVLTDHGSAFGTSRKYVSAFTALLWALEVEHIQGRVAHPQTQGKVERFNRTLQSECLRLHSHATREAWEAALEEYRQLYNTIRPHQALGQETPDTLYTPSPRAFVEPDKSSVPEGVGYQHRRVDSGGKIWLFSHHLLVSSGLSGWRVSASHDGEGYWTIWFRGHALCQVHLAKGAPYKPKP
jgi:transposase InsO family protein